MSLAELESQISISLKNLEGKVELPNYEQWVDFFFKVKDSGVLLESEKIRRYLILISTIEQYNEAIYLNSPFVILRDSLKETLKDIGGVSLGILKNLPVICGAIILVISIILLRK